MASIIIFILLILFTVGIIAFNAIKKQFIDTKNFIFFIPALAILIAIYIVGYIDAGNQWDGISFFECFKAAYDGFKLVIKRGYVEGLMNKDPFFAIDVYWGTILAGLTLFSAVMGIFKVAIINFFASLIKRCKELDIVIGDNDECIKYAKKHKNCVYWIDSSSDKLTNDDKKKLFLSKVTYIYQPFTGKKIARFTLLAKKNVHIICFQKNGKYLPTLTNAVKKLPKNNKQYNFHVQAEEEIISFVDDELAKLTKDKTNVTMVSFDLYELVARNFNLEHNLAKYLPNGVIENYLVKDKNYPINVVMLGFGKTAYALFRGLILNNQFVHENNGKFECHKVNYYLFDKDKAKFDKPIITYFQNFEKVKDKYLNAQDLEPLDIPCHIVPKQLNFKGNLFDDLLPLFENKQGFTYFFICSSSSIDNAAIAKQISRVIKQDQCVIFYNDDNQKNSFSINQENNIFSFGFKNQMFTHKSICNDVLWEKASDCHKAYIARNKGQGQGFEELFLTEKLSNIYRAVNVEFKLNCLGYYLDSNEKDHISIDDFYKNVIGEAPYEYEDNFKVSINSAIAFQEHTRWNISYFLSGYRPMPLEEIKFENDKIIHKNHDSKKHACLVSYYALDKLIKYEEQLISKSRELVPGERDCIKFDLLHKEDDLKKNIEEKGLFIHKK